MTPVRRLGRNVRHSPHAQSAAHRHPPAAVAGAILLLLFAALYLVTLDDGLRPGELAGGDLITHQYAQAQGRFSNAPGYPLYTMGGWLWFRIGRLFGGPGANPIPILSSYSTLWALVALGLLYVLILEVTKAPCRPGFHTAHDAAADEHAPILRAVVHAAGGYLLNNLGGAQGGSVIRRISAESRTRLEQLTPAGLRRYAGGNTANENAGSGRSGKCPKQRGRLFASAVFGLESGNWPIAVLTTAFYGVTYFFWYYAVTTEQYTSSVAWTLAAVLLAFRWQRARRDRDLLGLALLTGIGLAHQITVLAVIPPILWLVLSSEPRVLRRPKLMLGVLGLALLPLLSYLYVYVRGAQHPEWRGIGPWSSTWHWFLAFVSTAQGRDELTWSLAPMFTPGFPALIWRELTWPGLIAGLLGWLTLGRRRAVMLYATLVIYLVFCWIDRLGNWFQVIMPLYALLAAGIGATADWLGRRYGDERAGTNRKGAHGTKARWLGEWPRGRVWQAILLLGLVLLVSYRGLLSYPRADSSGRADDTGLMPGWAILADAPPPDMAILGTQPEALALNYLAQIWGRRPDLRVITSTEAQVLLAGPGFAVTETALPLVAAEVSPDARYSALGRTLVRVSLAPNRVLPADLMPWEYDFGQVVRLAGGRVQENRTTREMVVLLVWQSSVQPGTDWSVSVRLAQGGTEIAQLDRQHPVFGAYPMTRWAPGEAVIDAYPFALPTAGDADELVIILYRRAADGSFTNLDVAHFPLR